MTLATRQKGNISAIFYFVLIDMQSCIITGKEVNLADQDVMLVPYTLNITGKET